MWKARGKPTHIFRKPTKAYKENLLQTLATTHRQPHDWLVDFAIPIFRGRLRGSLYEVFDGPVFRLVVGQKTSKKRREQIHVESPTGPLVGVGPAGPGKK